MPIVQLFSGHETHRDPSASFRIGFTFKPTLVSEVTAIHLAAKDPHSGVKLLATQSLPAAEGNPNAGQFWDNRYEVPEGTMLVAMIERRKYDQSETIRAAFLVYEDGALNRFKVDTAGHPNGARSAGYVEGRLQLVGPALFERMKLAGLPGYLNEYEEFVAEVQEIEPGQPYTPPTSKTINLPGGKSIRVSARSRRRINLTP